MPYQRHDKDGNPVTAIASYVRHDKDGNPVALKKYQRHDKDGNALGPRAEYQRRDSSNTLDSPQPESRTHVDAFGNVYKNYNADYEARDVDRNLLDDFESVFNRSNLDLDFAGNKSLIDAVSGNYLIDFVRDTESNSSTYVDAAGLIKRSVTNLLGYSEDLGTGWATTSGSVVTTNVTSNPINNLTDADKLAVGTSSFPQITQSPNTTVANTHTFSAYVKADGVDFVQLRVRNAGATSNYFRAIFNLTDGNITQNTAFGNGTYTSGSAVSVGNGWWRLSITGIADTSGTQATVLFILMSDEDGNVATPSTNDATDGIYIWGSQLEEASTVGEYVKTTTTKSGAPRFDHDPATGESLGLLVEESRENIMTYSAATTSNWTNAAATLTDLSLNALGVFPGVRAASLGQVYQGINTPAVTLTDGTTYTVTFWFRAGDVNPSNMIRFLLRNDTDAKVSTVIKTSTSTNYEDVSAYSQSEGTTGAPTNVTILSVEKLSDGLTYKMSVSFDAVGVDKSHVFGIHTNSTVSGESIIALGLQLEEGAFPTSYIPTEGAAVTRGADAASISGTNFSGFYSGSEHTIFSDSTVQDTEITQFVWTLRGGTYFTSMRQPQNGVDLFRAQVGDTFSTPPGIGNISDKKATLAFSDTSASFQVGSTLDTFAVTNASDPTLLAIGSYNTAGGNSLNGTIKRLTYWNQRLTNTILGTITS